MSESGTVALDSKQAEAGAAVARAAAIMARLRGPGGCPWDREQTFDSIKRHTLEETYEVFDAIERRDWPDLRDELGDLLLQVLFYAQMAEEAGRFTLEDVAQSLTAKLVRRHPHIFGEAVAEDAEAVKRTWDRVKAEEKQGTKAAGSVLDGIPRTMPAMLEAEKLGSRAAKVGFDWPSVDGLFEKLDEEIAELRAELPVADEKAESSPLSSLRVDDHKNAERVQDEFGDLLFTAMNLGRHLRLDAESALRGANAKFRRRFTAMERAAGDEDALRAFRPEELEAMWKQSKAAEAVSGDSQG